MHSTTPMVVVGGAAVLVIQEGKPICFINVQCFMHARMHECKVEVDRDFSSLHAQHFMHIIVQSYCINFMLLHNNYAIYLLV